jgi:hypothetical protein
MAHGRELLLDEHQQLTAVLAEVERVRALSPELAAALESVSTAEAGVRPAAELLDLALEAEVRVLRQAAEQLAEHAPDLVGEQLSGLREALMRYLHDQDRRNESVITIAHTC